MRCSVRRYITGTGVGSLKTAQLLGGASECLVATVGAGANGSACLSFAVSAGVAYGIQLVGQRGTPGTVQLNWALRGECKVVVMVVCALSE